MSDLLDKISSKYLLLKIFEYVKNEKTLKLFIHSKKYIKKMGLLFYYQYNYLKAVGINLFDYLSFNIVEGKINKKLLNDRFKEDLKNIDININFSPQFLINYYNEFIRKLSIVNQIDIYSPIFEILSKTDLINQFSIIIQMNIIKESNFYNDYISIFQKLKKIKSKYSSILFKYENFKDIDYLFKFNIKFSQIKELLISDSKFSTCSDRSKDEMIIDNSYYSLKKVFTHKNIKNNLLHLELNSYNQIEIESNLFEPLNDFKVLEELSLHHFKFKNNFSLKLKNLKELELISCENISFENCCLNLNILGLNDYNITPPKSLLKFPNLESCDLNDNSKIDFNLLIDFKSLKNIKTFSASGIYFLNLEKDSLISAECYFNEINDDIIAKKILNKLLSFKYLESLCLKSFEMSIDEISKSEGLILLLIY